MSPTRAVAALLVCCCFVAGATAAPWVSGVATWTGSEDKSAQSVANGACGYGTMSAASYPGFKLAGVSLSKSIFARNSLKGCGTCIEIKCSDKEACSSTSPVTVMVYDNCDKCETNQINMQAVPFSQLAALDVGRVGIMYREVPCAFAGGVTVGVDSFRASGGGWARLVFKNVNGADLKSAEISKAGADAFVPLKNSFGAAWEASRLPALPWDIKLTNAEGKSIVLKSAITSDKTGDVATSLNF